MSSFQLLAWVEAINLHKKWYTSKDRPIPYDVNWKRDVNLIKDMSVWYNTHKDGLKHRSVTSDKVG